MRNAGRWAGRAGGAALLAGAALAAAGVSAAPRTAEASRPRLIVLLGLDQFGSFYLEEYADLFEGGFARLLREGRRYPRAEVAHAPSLTWPGFATLSTGAHPMHHGVSSHRVFWTWPERDVQGHLPSLDPGERVPGFPAAEAYSGRDLRVTTLADWVRAAHPRAISVAIGQTYGGIAAMLGGRTRDPEGRAHAYWLLPGEPAYVTSSFYQAQLPAWLERFNARSLPDLLAADTWELSVPERARGRARRDAAAFEGDGGHVSFPHRFEAEVPGAATASPEQRERQRRSWLARTPMGDAATFALAREALAALELGRDEATDLLAIGIKSTDRIGHDYGPRSLEQLDVLCRLDRELGALFELLDREVGRDRWALALSADHGGPFVPEAEQESGRPGRRIAAEEMEGLLARVDALVRAHEGSRDELRSRVVAELEAADFIERAWTPDALAASGPADELTRAYRHSYVPGQVWSYPLWTRDELATGRLGETHPAHLGIVAEVSENAHLWTARSTHGSAWAYDRHVPLVLLGPGVSPGIARGPARTVDVAPTLAAWAGIPVPPSADGTPLPLGGTTSVTGAGAGVAEETEAAQDRSVGAVEDDYPAWSPDGSRLVFYSNRDGSGFMQIFVMAADGSGLTQLTRTRSHNRTPVFSPDGSAILFQAERDGNREIYLMSADGSQPRNLTRHAAEDSHPKFLPDGSGFVFDSTRVDPEAEEVYAARLDGNGLQRITHDDAVDTYASVSPDGSRLLWRRVLPAGGSSASGRNSEIFVSRRDGSEPLNLTRHPSFDGYPGWFPDGRRIVFASNRTDDPARTGDFSLYAMDVDGSNLVRLTETPAGAADVRPSVSPDGRFVAYNRDWPDGSATIHVLAIGSAGR